MMKGIRIAVVIAALVGTAAVAAAGDMVLTRSGDLYRIAQTEDGLSITGTLSDGSVVEHTVPQTDGVDASFLNLVVDKQADAIFVLWQEGADVASVVNFASLNGAVWYGPVTLAGGDGAAAASPRMIRDRVVSEVDLDGTIIEVATTFLHMVWWGFVDSPDDGAAFYAPVALDDEGQPVFDGFEPIALSDLLPYGIACEGIENAAELAHPRFFVDPKSGLPQVFATDFAECLFQILEIGYEVIVDPVTERRRHSVVFGRSNMIGIDRDLPLDSSWVAVGRDQTLVLYWDSEGAVEYVRLAEQGSSDIMSLELGDDLSHRQAIDLIRSLVE
jgi:hypothetical protein